MYVQLKDTHKTTTLMNEKRASSRGSTLLRCRKNGPLPHPKLFIIFHFLTYTSTLHINFKMNSDQKNKSIASDC